VPRIEGLARDERLTRRMSWVCPRELLGVCAPWPCLKSACGRRADSLKQNRESSYPTSAQRHDSYRVSDRTTAIDSRVRTGNLYDATVRRRYGAFARARIKTRAPARRVRVRRPIRARRGAPAVTIRLRDRRFHFRRSKRFHTVRPLCVHRVYEFSGRYLRSVRIRAHSCAARPGLCSSQGRGTRADRGPMNAFCSILSEYLAAPTHIRGCSFYTFKLASRR